MADLTRRQLVQAGLAATVAMTAAKTAVAGAAPGPDTSGKAFTYSHDAKPLPFNPKALTGISEKLIVSHWENNYTGSVRALNVVRGKLREALATNDPPYLYTDYKREHLVRTGSVVLHELYFGNLGGDGKTPADLRTKLATAFGSYDAWETEFRRIGAGLGGGSGWVVLGMNEHLGVLENYWLADHTSNPAFTKPILVMDMYEHAYQMDYGAATAKYIDAFMTNINWETVAARLEGRKA